MRVDEDADHAQAFIFFDEAHATHVAREVVNGVATLHRIKRFLAKVQIRDNVFGAWVNLIPLVLLLHVDAANFESLLQQIADEMSADKSTAATNDYISFSH